jgi:dTDP-4-dehydrorhamnose reductase
LVHQKPRLELWGGVECTINRVGDSYLEQLGRTGHDSRLSDFDHFAKLGFRALRHGVLWERTAPSSLEEPNWAWADASLHRLRELGIRPIVGLVHHGSGPRQTNLLDSEFPQKLALYASKVAQRFPWVTDYTPVNEPLTTARFSGLYGLWYPHGKDDLSFSRALLNQCRAIVLTMRAIREVNSSARLVQTDDLGKIFSTPKLRYQAEFENERRWCSYDLLCGRLNREHPLWGYFRWAGIPESELEWFLDNPCPPDVVGINLYLSGQRFLDEHVERYPDVSPGGNGRDRYVDVLAARVLRDGADRPQQLLTEAWNRYQIPVAVTECHNGCTREEQLRWVVEVWRDAEAAATVGARVIAVTAWSLLGAFDWNSLVTRAANHYEPGVFDIRSPQPRATALAALFQQLGRGQLPRHPLLDVPGWWHRPARFVYGHSLDHGANSMPAAREDDLSSNRAVRPVLIIGARGTLGKAFAKLCALRGIPHRLLSRQECDIADQASVRRSLFRYQPWAVINAAGYVRVDEAELDRERCYRENVQGPRVLAEICAMCDVRLLTFSSDLVFAGDRFAPYVEGDEIQPLNHYGATKAAAEAEVLARMPSALIIRTSAFFGPWDSYNFVSVALRTLQSNREFWAADDSIVSPTYVPDLVNTSLDLLIDGEHGIWHLANAGEISWAGLAEKAACLAHVTTGMLKACATEHLDLPARRPRYSVLGSQRGLLMPPLDDALMRYFEQRQVELDIQADAA